MIQPPQTRGFTLVEMAVVLVIIGLMLGGVLGGQALLKRSEMQTVLTDLAKYTQAVGQFRQQYGSFPGDILDATSYWGKNTTSCNSDTQDAGTPGTCNGNSDGDMMDSDEPYRAWQHLVLANYIEGSFTGIAQGSAPVAAPGTNVPKSRIGGAGWSFWYKPGTGALATPAAAADTNLYDAKLDNYLAFGATTTSNLGTMTTFTRGAVLTPSEAYQIDRKIDDGKPGTGKALTLKPAAMASCASSATDASATYALTTTSPTCSLLISLTPRQ